MRRVSGMLAVGVAVICAAHTGHAIVGGTDALWEEFFAAGAAYVPGEMLVKFNEHMEDDAIKALMNQVGSIILDDSPWVDFLVISVPEDMTVLEAADWFGARSEVIYAEPDYIGHVFFTPNDQYYWQQWGPGCIGAEQAWNHEQGNHSVTVAVLDTGVDLDHPDLDFNVDTSIDYDFVNGDDQANDDFGHGTHCIGIVAAEIDNSIGVAGLQQVRIMAVKVANVLGMATAGWIAKGINYATANGADVISMSLGMTSNSSAIRDACLGAWNGGVLVVAAAGNSNTSTRTYPAAYSTVIGVAALETCTQRAGYSNYGWENVELAAPGSNVYSTMPTYPWFTLWLLGYSRNYDSMSGTSMACPHVAAVGAAYFCYMPTMTNVAVRTHMRANADDLGAPGPDEYYGYGRVDMWPTD